MARSLDIETFRFQLSPLRYSPPSRRKLVSVPAVAPCLAQRRVRLHHLPFHLDCYRGLYLVRLLTLAEYAAPKALLVA